MRRRELSAAVSIVAAALIAASAYLLATRLGPATSREGGIAVDLDVSGLGPGELRKFASWEGEYWVVRRTPEQLAALERRPPHTAPDRAGEPGRERPLDSPLRSADPAYFVFRVQRIGDGIMLREYPERYVVCSDLRLFAGERAYAGGYVIIDGLSCADDPQIAYDLAGMPSSPYFAPLEVPEHEVRRGILSVHPGL